jgi:glycosyltransferase involved in cell wall biosynthesis
MNNPNKITFICRVTDDSVFKECEAYIDSLILPEGMQMETVTIKEPMTDGEAYQKAMLASDSKYKVYLQQNVFLVYKKFISELIHLFATHPNLGIISAIGAKTPQVGGRWRDSAQKYGKRIEYSDWKMKVSAFLQPVEAYESVAQLDGALLATQYDLPWRVDLLKGRAFLGETRSREFINAGYEAGVPRQTESWTLFDQSLDELDLYEKEDRIGFLNCYSHDLFPKVSVLIPTYNRPDYVRLALESVLQQSYRNIEIIIGDDSTNDDTEILMQDYIHQYPRIRYFRNQTNLGQFDNSLRCMELAEGEYINFLMDDDLFHPQKIERMMEYYLGEDGQSIRLVTSHRAVMDGKGELRNEHQLNVGPFQQNTILLGIDFANLLLKHNWNFIGEPTTVLFRKSDLTEPFGVFVGRRYGCNVDSATWLNLLSEGKAVYLTETLSYFRIHKGQQLQSEKMLLMGAEDYAHEIINAREKGYLLKEEDYLVAVNNCSAYLDKVRNQLGGESSHEQLEIYYDELKKISSDQIRTPLVSILIPSFNRSYYLELALNSALKQIYQNIEIIICDDSTNDDVQKTVTPYLQKDSRILYYRNKTNLGQYENSLKCMELSSGEYINFLKDDDLLHPEKIERMMSYFLNDYGKRISLVTSGRQLIDGLGNPLSEQPKPLFAETTTVDGTVLGDYVLKLQMNVIGGPSTVLFRKEALSEPFGTFSGKRYGCNVDLASWLNLLSAGVAVYIPEPLSSFRIHGDKQQHSLKMRIAGLMDFAHQILKGYEKGFLLDFHSMDEAIRRWLQIYMDFIKTEFGSVHDDQDYMNLLDTIDEMQQRLRSVNKNNKRNAPLISVLIPAYNRPKFLEQAIQSVILQTYPNFELVICDDSTNDNVEIMIQPYLQKYPWIRYYRNEVNLNIENPRKCFNLAKGEYVNYLMDDDLFHPFKLEKMAHYLENPNFCLITSYRAMIDENGKLLPDIGATARMFNEDKVINGIALGNHVLTSLINVIGEPTTVLLRKRDIGSFGTFQGKEYTMINDLATWLSLLSKGSAVYIAEPLSFFRQHQGQNQKNPKYLVEAIGDYANVIEDSRKSGFLVKEQDYRRALRRFMQTSLEIIDFYNEWGLQSVLTEKKATEHCANVLTKLVEYKDPYFCPCCGNRFAKFLPLPEHYRSPRYVFEMYNTETALCPVCFSHDRERLYRIYLEQEEDLNKGPVRILHVAPEHNLRDWLTKHETVSYTCGDLYPTDETIDRLDITAIHYDEGSFDIILCSHVLEHVPDDLKAMQELYRVMKPGGWGILQVPLALNLEETYEDFSIVSPEERLIAFGQEDHVRVYAKDYTDRLKKCGFVIEVFNYAERHSIVEAKRIGLSSTDNLYIVKKPS